MHAVLILVPMWLVATFHLLSLGTTPTKLRHMPFTDFVQIMLLPMRYYITGKDTSSYYEGCGKLEDVYHTLWICYKYHNETIILRRT